MAITKLVLNGTEYQIGNLITVDGPQLYDGREIEEYTWEQLKAKCTSYKNGNTDAFNDIRVGDYKTIENIDITKFTATSTLQSGVTGLDTRDQTVIAKIAGINTYYRTCDTNVGPHIDWISEDLLYTLPQWNKSNINNGNSTESCPYMVSNVKSFLDDFYNTLPSDLQSVITSKRFLLEQRYSSSSVDSSGNGTLTDSTGWTWKDLGKLWLPSEYEVYGSTVWGTKGFSSGQAVQYPLFANSWQNRIKMRGSRRSPVSSTSRYSWRLSTVYSGTSTHCCYVSSNGHAGNTYASNTPIGVPVCFRIAA